MENMSFDDLGLLLGVIETQMDFNSPYCSVTSSLTL
jgi:hypothetical protein